MPWSFQWPCICGRNSSAIPDRPSKEPTSTSRRIGRPMKRRRLTAFQIGAVEKTTATRPLGTHWLA